MDRDDPEGDRWAEMDPGSEIPEKYVLIDRRAIWPTFEEREFFQGRKGISPNGLAKSQQVLRCMRESDIIRSC